MRVHRVQQERRKASRDQVRPAALTALLACVDDLDLRHLAPARARAEAQEF